PAAGAQFRVEVHHPPVEVRPQLEPGELAALRAELRQLARQLLAEPYGTFGRIPTAPDALVALQRERGGEDAGLLGAAAGIGRVQQHEPAARPHRSLGGQLHEPRREGAVEALLLRRMQPGLAPYRARPGHRQQREERREDDEQEDAADAAHLGAALAPNAEL